MISFIIPIYKVESYLDQCISSIVNQTYKEIEVILVDDGSPDGCPAMCDRWAEKDPRIRAFHKTNGGLSDARNYGLERATGDYVVFVDGDDYWINNTSLAEMVSLLETYPNVDFVCYKFSYYYTETDTFREIRDYPYELLKPVEKDKAIQLLIASGIFPMSAWLKIMRKSFLVDNKLFFQKGIVAEDIPWFINVMEKTGQCVFSNESVYAYRQNVAGSITNSNARRSYENLFNIFTTELDLLDSRLICKESKNCLKSFLAYEYSILLTNKTLTQTDKKELYGYKYILNYTTHPKVRLASLIYHTFGIRITMFALCQYQKIRKMRK